MNWKVCAVFLEIIFVLNLFSGCSGNNQMKNVELTVEIFDRNNVPRQEGTLKDNRWVRYVKEEMQKIGIDITFYPVTRGEEKETLNYLMAANSAPDIVFTYDRRLVVTFANAGGLNDLGSAIEEFGPNIQKLHGKAGILDYGVINGKQYAIPAWRTSINHRVELIRKDWLDKVGKKVPENRDELVDVLKAFRDSEPDVLGVKRVIPYGKITGPFNFESHDFNQWNAMYSFFTHDVKELYTTPIPLREGFKDFMAWMNYLYKEDLIDPEFATDTLKIAESKITKGYVGFCSLGWWVLPSMGYHEDYAELKKESEDAEFIPAEVFQNSDGKYYKARYPDAGLYIFSPKTSGSIESVVKYVNWLLEEEVSRILSYGIEGEHYELIGNIPVPIDTGYNLNTLKYINGDLLIPWNGNPVAADNRDMLKYIKAIYGEWGDFAAESYMISGKDTVQEALFAAKVESEDKYMAELSILYEEYWIKMIMADEFEAVYHEFAASIKDKSIYEIYKERSHYYTHKKYINFGPPG